MRRTTITFDDMDVKCDAQEISQLLDGGMENTERDW